jgi:Polyketide cyclase / dehydrase and lipid transport
MRRIPRYPEPMATGSVTVGVSPAEAYALVSDPMAMVGMAEEAYRVQWLDGAARSAVGARFKGRNRNGRRRWTTVCRITDAEPDRRFGYEVATTFGVPISRWQYDVEPAPEGCTITERTWLRAPLWFLLIGAAASGVVDRAGANAAHIATTLDRLKAHLDAAGRL